MALQKAHDKDRFLHLPDLLGGSMFLNVLRSVAGWRRSRKGAFYFPSPTFFAVCWCLTAGMIGLPAVAEAQDALQAKNVLARNDAFPEYIALSFITTEHLLGRTAAADCMLEKYFDDPVTSRVVVEKSWEWKNGEGRVDYILPMYLTVLCEDTELKGGFSLLAPMTKMEQITIDPGKESDLFFATYLGALASASISKNKQALDCIGPSIKDKGFVDAVQLRFKDNKNEGIVAIYAKMIGERCAFNADYKKVESINANADITVAAKERIVAVSTFNSETFRYCISRKDKEITPLCFKMEREKRTLVLLQRHLENFKMVNDPYQDPLDAIEEEMTLELEMNKFVQEQAERTLVVVNDLIKLLENR